MLQGPMQRQMWLEAKEEEWIRDENMKHWTNVKLQTVEKNNSEKYLFIMLVDQKWQKIQVTFTMRSSTEDSARRQI